MISIMTRKKYYVFLAIILFLSIPVVYILFGQSIYGKLTAPKLTKAAYVETTYDKQSFCIIACKYYPKYNYSASGPQKAVIESIAKDFEKLGYTYRIRDGEIKPTVGCYGEIGDRYQFKKLSAPNGDYTEELSVTFYGQAYEDDKYSDEIGCGRSDREYRVEITGGRNYWVGA